MTVGRSKEEERDENLNLNKRRQRTKQRIGGNALEASVISTTNADVQISQGIRKYDKPTILIYHY